LSQGLAGLQRFPASRPIERASRSIRVTTSSSPGRKELKHGSQFDPAFRRRPVERDEPGDVSALFEMERLATDCVTATRARTTAGIGSKAMLLDACGEGPEMVALLLSIGEDTLALVKGMVGADAVKL
jgi:hypothetical protein